MQASEVKTVADAARIVNERELDYVKVGLFDADGVMRGKYMHRDKFLSSLDGGFGFCDVVLGWDSNDQLYDNVQITGWQQPVCLPICIRRIDHQPPGLVQQQ